MATLLETLRANYDEAAKYGSEEDRSSRPFPSEGGPVVKALGLTSVQGKNGGRAYVTKGGTEIPAWALWTGAGLLAWMLFGKGGR